MWLVSAKYVWNAVNTHMPIFSPSHHLTLTSTTIIIHPALFFLLTKTDQSMCFTALRLRLFCSKTLCFKVVNRVWNGLVQVNHLNCKLTVLRIHLSCFWPVKYLGLLEKYGFQIAELLLWWFSQPRKSKVEHIQCTWIT